MSIQPQQFETQEGATGYASGQEAIGQGMGQPMGGQQMGGQQQAGGQQQMGGQQSFESSLTGPMRLTLHDFVESLTVCDWCADQCIGMGPEMADCIRLCRDVSDLAALNVQLMARDSIFGPEAAQLFAQAAEECARECARHPHAHCQECAATLSRAVDSTRKMLGSFQQQGQAGMGQGQPGMSQGQPGMSQTGMGQTGQTGQSQFGGQPQGQQLGGQQQF